MGPQKYSLTVYCNMGCERVLCQISGRGVPPTFSNWCLCFGCIKFSEYDALLTLLGWTNFQTGSAKNLAFSGQKSQNLAFCRPKLPRYGVLTNIVKKLYPWQDRSPRQQISTGRTTVHLPPVLTLVDGLRN